MSLYMAALLIEWVGAFFLAVEAIKLRNIRHFRKFLKTSSLVINPSLELRTQGVGTRVNRLLHLYLVAYLIFGAVVIYGVGHAFDIWKPLHVRWMALSGWWIAFVSAGGLLIGIMAAMLVATTIIPLFQRLLRLVIRGLIFVQRNTANGMIGVIGFVLFTLATTMKFIYYAQH